MVKSRPNLHDLQPYPSYKNSGVPWLGQVPEHWKQVPGRACFQEKKESNTGLKETIVLSLSYGRIIVKTADKLHGLVPASFETYQIINPGDIIVRPTDLQNDKVSLRFGLSNSRGIITSAYMCLQTKSELLREYGYLLLHSYDLKKVFYGLGSGLRQNLDWRDFKYLPCSLPPLDEQEAIVRYLDYVDRRVRRNIRAKQKLIKLLEEQKQAIIHQAVTRGLDPDVRLKPSGVGWLGDVPEHWEVQRIKQSSKILRGKFSHRPRNDPSLYDGAYPFIQTGEIARANKRINTYKQTLNEKGYAVSKQFPAGTLLMTIAANIGDVAILEFEACFPDSIVGFIPQENIIRDYLYYVLLIMKSEFLRQAPVNTQGNLNIERIGIQRIAIPSILEQKKIINFIEEETEKLDHSIEKYKLEIYLFQEYRTRLIADVVTGKLDVRAAAAQLPAEMEEILEGEDEAFEDEDDLGDEEDATGENEE